MTECRICLSVSSNEVLLSPCLCRGSVRYVHQRCLEHWLKAKYQNHPHWMLGRARNGQTGFNCELCHYEYKGKWSLVSPYLIFERLFSSQSSVSILLNIFVIIYMLYKLKKISNALAQYCFKLLCRTPSLRMLLPRLVKVLFMLISTGVYTASLPIMLLSTWQLTEGIISECCKLEIEPYVKINKS